MPIKFRCRHCRQFLGISRARAGTITDCPTCGKSIRVPNLDGSIDPIPSPVLDLQDDQLVDALGELAELGNPRGSNNPREGTLPFRGPSTQRISAAQEATLLAPQAEAVRLPDAEPAFPINSPTPKESDTVVQGGEKVGTVIEPEEVLRSLAEVSPRHAVVPVRSRRSRRESFWVIGGLTAAAVLSLPVLFWVARGRQSPPLSLDAAVEERLLPANAEADEADDPLPGGLDRPQVPAGDAATLSGRATYVDANGGSRPDAGARILLLPRVKPGSVKLDVTGFLTGADDVDTRVGRAALRAMGGDLAEADEDGRFTLQFTERGDYALLAISRHLSREIPDSVDPRLQDALSTFFFRPGSLLGRLAYRSEDLRYDGRELPPRSISFATQ